MAGTVTVGCKLPNGLILRLFNMVETQELVLGGGMRQIKEARNIGEKVFINGNMAPEGKALVDRFGEQIMSYSGFATTPNVDAEFWDAWYEQNKHSDIVRNGLVFAHTKSIDIKAEAREKEGVRSGLERLEGAEDKRVGNRRQKLPGGGISSISKDDGK